MLLPPTLHVPCYVVGVVGGASLPRSTGLARLARRRGRRGRRAPRSCYLSLFWRGDHQCCTAPQPLDFGCKLTKTDEMALYLCQEAYIGELEFASFNVITLSLYHLICLHGPTGRTNLDY